MVKVMKNYHIFWNTSLMRCAMHPRSSSFSSWSGPPRVKIQSEPRKITRKWTVYTCIYICILNLYLHMYLYLSSTSSTHFIDEASHQCSAWEEALRENLLLPVHSCPLRGQHHVSSNICSCWCLYLYLTSRSQHRVRRGVISDAQLSCTETRF